MLGHAVHAGMALSWRGGCWSQAGKEHTDRRVQAGSPSMTPETEPWTGAGAHENSQRPSMARERTQPVCPSSSTCTAGARLSVFSADTGLQVPSDPRGLSTSRRRRPQLPSAQLAGALAVPKPGSFFSQEARAATVQQCWLALPIVPLHCSARFYTFLAKTNACCSGATVDPAGSKPPSGMFDSSQCNVVGAGPAECSRLLQSNPCTLTACMHDCSARRNPRPSHSAHVLMFFVEPQQAMHHVLEGACWKPKL